MLAGLHIPMGRAAARLCIAAAAAGVMIVAAGCGSSNDSSTAPTAAATTAATKPTGQPIRIAMLNETTQPGEDGLPEVVEAAQARVDHINAAGGIKGRPVELLVCDTKKDPNAARACARQAASSGAVAAVGMVVTNEDVIFPILERAGIAAIGTTPTTPAAGESPAAFCFNAGVAGAFSGVAPALTQAGATKVSMIYPSNVGAASAHAKEAFDEGVKQTGLENGGTAGYNFGATQFDAQVASATADDVDGVFPFSPGSTVALLLQAVRQQAPDVNVVELSVSLRPDVFDALGSQLDGISTISLTQPASATQLPGIKEFNADMDTYAPESAFRGDHAINAWASVWAFEQVASKLARITPATVTNAMRHVKDLRTGGVYPPLSAPAGASPIPGLSCAMNTSIVMTKVQDGKVVAQQPGRFFDPFAPPAG
jgi:branched-chain amino acid transport system substrate-binding protein